MSRDRPGLPPALVSTVPRSVLLCAALFSLFCFPSHAGFAVQRIVQIPAEPWQQVVSLQTDSQGNLIAGAIVNPQGSFDPALSFGLIKKVSPPALSCSVSPCRVSSIPRCPWRSIATTTSTWQAEHWLPSHFRLPICLSRFLRARVIS